MSKTPRIRRDWLPAELDYLRQNAHLHPSKLAARLGRRKSSVYGRLVAEGLHTPKPRLGGIWVSPQRARVLQYITEALEEGVTVADVLGDRLTLPTTRVRWAVIARLKADGYGLSGIGRALNLDHTSVMYALKRMAKGEPPRPRNRNGHGSKVKKLKPIPYAGFDPSERLPKAA